MKAIAGPQKLRFTVESCSGEDSDYPVRELLYHSPQTRGWQSPRFCNFPQEIVLRVERPSKIQQIQILAHECKVGKRLQIHTNPKPVLAAQFKLVEVCLLRRCLVLQLAVFEEQIPSKIDVFVGVAGPAAAPDADPAAAAGSASSYRRLGYLAFDKNERSNHQARELKSVHLSVETQLVRLLIHRCHVNKLNIYNQVGIIALNLIGEPLQAAPEGPAPYLDVDGPVSHELQYYNRAAAEVADLQLDVHVDSSTAARIKELARAKDAAVAAEDYDEAKRLKASIERLKMVGGKIAQLEARKRLAVEREDYDLAKALKADIEKLRQQVVHTYQAYEDRPAVAKASYMSQARQEVLGLDDDALIRADPATVSAAALFGARGASTAGTSGGSRRSMGGAGAAAAASAAASAGRDYDGGGGSSGQSAGSACCTAPAPAGWPGDLPTPEPLTASSCSDAAPVAEVAGEFVAAAFFSRNWQLRDAAAAWLADLVGNGRLNGGPGAERRELAKGLVRLAVRGLKDKVPQVYCSCLGLLQALLMALAANGGSRDVHSAVEAALPVLLERLADNNARLRDSARDALVSLAQLLQDLVPLLGLAAPAGIQSNGRGSSGGGDGFDLNEVMDYVGKALNSGNADVRAAALRVAVAVAACAAGGGAAVRRLLPKDLNPKLREQADAALGGDVTGAAGPAAVAESCSNLAILYNQQGDYAAAQPLYERALAIYEATYGPNHQEVAHTLTDLAVLHLEQRSTAAVIDGWRTAVICDSVQCSTYQSSAAAFNRFAHLLIGCTLVAYCLQSGMVTQVWAQLAALCGHYAAYT
ncbi:flagellar associated protein [Scenedesmus sp. NREL 46B-D3]|nr:flagellar associated protein [Scenedesmus sp. NREL 46B-D3]